MLSAVTAEPLINPKLIAVSSYAQLLPQLSREWPNAMTLGSGAAADFWAGGSSDSALQGTASVYSGHQFGVWAGQLGDGRAMSVGVVQDAFGRPQELQLKGAGLTPYSRMGDGRAVLRSSVREFLCSEAMAALDIPTTRALTLVQAKTAVIRETVEDAAVVCRVAPSFIRFGHFEHFFYHDRHQQLKKLFDFVLNELYPELQSATNPPAAVLSEIVKRSARLVAQWQAVGFCHGVLNTDNMSILGLTIDYGPFGFLEAFDPGHICNHTDQQGRYSWQNQPGIVQWNCYALGQAFVPLIGSVDETKQALSLFKTEYDAQMAWQWQRKLGLTAATDSQTADVLSESKLAMHNLIDDMFKLMEMNQCDWTRWFRALSQPQTKEAQWIKGLQDEALDSAAVQTWANQYLSVADASISDRQLRSEMMLKVNPKYVLRNYIAQLAISAAGDANSPGDDGEKVRQIESLLRAPFAEQPESENFAHLPPDWARNLEVSCSS